MRLALLFVLFFSGTGLSAGPLEQEMALARQVLTDLQEQSIRDNREYCGLIGRDPQGRLVATEAVRGSRARCRYPDPPPGTVLVASYHTHGAFLSDYDNEVPSAIDVRTEMMSGTRGYVSTPGGRFWLIDGRAGTARLICDAKCLPWDPRYRAWIAGTVKSRYSIYDLVRRQEYR